MKKIISDILAFNWHDFHFLRPDWLWFFAPAALVLILLLINTNQKNKWKKIIAPALRPYMFTKEKKASISFPLIMFALLMCIGIVALAGPSWKMKVEAEKQNEAQLVIAIDASLSMMAEDVQPNRLERAKFKIKDLINENPRAKISLYAYSGLSFMVVPACDDYSLITLHLDAIKPATMPIQGSNLPAMIAQVDSTLKNFKAPSTLLIMTDVLSENDKQAIIQFADSSIHRVEICALASIGGAQIPINKQKKPALDAQGNIVISKLNQQVLLQLSAHPKITVNTPTIDKSDMQILAKRIRENLYFSDSEKMNDDDWEDMGYLFVIIITLIMPFWFRKGWMIQYVFIGVICTSCHSDDWKNMWQTSDYQAQKFYENKEYAKAAEMFTKPINKGAAYFKDGNYDAAAQAFEQDSSSSSFFNLSLCLLNIGEYNNALHAIEIALQKEPENQLFTQLFKQIEEQKIKADSIIACGDSVLIINENENEKEAFQAEKAKNNDEELSADTEVDKLPEDGKRITDEAKSNNEMAQELEEVPDDFKLGKEKLPANILMQGISEDPQEFLTRRFKYQLKKMNGNQENHSQEEYW